MKSTEFKFFRAYAEQSDDCLFVLEADGADESPRIVYCNRAALDAHGFAREELEGRPISAIMTPETKARLPLIRREILAGRSYVFESRHLRKDGETITADVTVRGIRFGRRRLVIGVGRDVGRQRDADDALRVSEQRFQSFMDHNPALALLKDADGRLLYANQTFFRVFGERAKRWIGTLDSEIWSPEGYAEVRAIDLGVLHTGKFCVITQRMPLDDGMHEFLTYKFPLVDDQGRRRYVGSVGVDVTDRLRAEESARQERERYQMLMEQAADGIVVVDRDGRVSDLNAQACKMAGYEREEILGRNVLEFAVADEQERLATSLVEAETNRTRMSVWKMRRKDGSVMMVEAHGSRLSDGRIQGVIRDISERLAQADRELQRQAELAHVARLSTLGQMIAGLAHEMNQPLHAIMNYAEACGEMIRAPRNQLPHQEGPLKLVLQWIDQLAEQSKRIATTIRRLMDFSRKGTPECERIAVDRLLQESVRLAEAELRWQGVVVRLERTAGTHHVHVNSLLLEQVLVNLLRNAGESVKSLPPANRTVTIGAKAGDGQITFSVHDLGPGISKDNLEKVFDAFYSTKETGLGMGLAISRSIVEAHRGKLWCEPNAGAGCTFHFRLPLAIEAAPAEPPLEPRSGDKE